METHNVTDNRMTALHAITTFKGASLEHDDDQKFYLMIGTQDIPESDVVFHKVCSFNLLDPNSIEIVPMINQRQLCSRDFEILKLSIQLVSYRLIEILCSEIGISLWGQDIPTPTEFVETYLVKKTFIFSTLSENLGSVYFNEIKDWKKQVKVFTAH